MRTGPILLAASGEGAVPSPARLLLTHTLPSKPTTTTLMTQIFVAIAHLHGKVAGIYLVVGAYSIYGPGAEHGTITQRMDSISTFQVMNRKIRQGSVYNDLTHRHGFCDDIVSQL